MKTTITSSLPPHLHNPSREDDLLSSIDTYVEKSINYRLDNPNFKPLTSELQPPISVSSSKSISRVSRHKPPMYSPLPMRYDSDDSDDRLPSPSIDLAETNTGRGPTPPPLLPPKQEDTRRRSSHSSSKSNKLRKEIETVKQQLPPPPIPTSQLKTPIMYQDEFVFETPPPINVSKIDDSPPPPPPKLPSHRSRFRMSLILNSKNSTPVASQSSPSLTPQAALPSPIVEPIPPSLVSTTKEQSNLEPETAQQATHSDKIRNRLKRLSLSNSPIGLTTHNEKPDENGQLQNRSSRFSWNNSIGKLPYLSPSTINVARMPSNTYTVTESPSSTISVNETMSSDLLKSSEPLVSRPADSPFWKYHILKFGKDLYLTTNPSLKHVYCRNGPGYFVEILHSEKIPDPRKGFTMLFKDLESIETGGLESIAPIMTITKKPEAEGGYFTIILPRLSILNKGIIKYLNTNDSQSRSKNRVFNGLALQKAIMPQFIPDVAESLEFKFNNYEFRDFNNGRWNVGSIPRVRQRTLTKLKEKFSTEEREPEDDRPRVVGKKNIYFHQNYIDLGENMETRTLLYKERSNDPKNIYFEDPNIQFPPVLALFRPYEYRTKIKIMKSFNKNKNRLLQHLVQQKQIFERNGLEYDKFIKGKALEHDIGVGGDVSKYYKGEDGLYYLTNPSDDSPDENKLGWITVYEDKRLFGLPGMFDIVLGLTLAVGYESSL